MNEQQMAYSGAETTGFQSPAQDCVEELIDLGRTLDLRKPGIYPVRVKGQAMQERGIRDGDILIANTALRPAHGKVAITILQGSFCLAMLIGMSVECRLSRLTTTPVGVGSRSKYRETPISSAANCPLAPGARAGSLPTSQLIGTDL